MFLALNSISNQITLQKFGPIAFIINQTFKVSIDKEGWWFLPFLFINLCVLFFFYHTLFFGHLFRNPLNVTFMVMNLDIVVTVTTIIMVTFVRLFRFYFIMSTPNQTFSFLLTETEFRLAFLHFVSLITVFSIKISLAVLRWIVRALPG